MNLRDLGKIIKEDVVEVLDHKNLNLDIDFMQGKQPSAEVLAMEIWRILQPKVEAYGAQMHKVLLEETDKNAVEYYG